ncbi:MAG: hypothetical protein ACLGH3_10040 [Actinomycetota bacterium]
MAKRLIVATLLAVSAAVPSVEAGTVDPPMSYAVTRTSGYASTVQVGSELVSPYLIVPQGGQLTFVNLHIWGHAIYSDAWKPGREDLERLFSSEVIPFGHSTLVEGVEDLEPGTYPFFCANHMGMKGELMIIPAGEGDR